ncbi:MAG: Ger(x)C family spore germination protein [Bacillota bacterium]|nr:Ger(x)C family spore germination protein [Bacillota bacterium]
MKIKGNSHVKLLGIIVTVTIFAAGVNAQPIEENYVASGIGYDIDKMSKETFMYRIPVSVYTFDGDRVSSTVVTGMATTIGETRQNRQLKSSSKFTLGFEKVYVFSDEVAIHGIRNIVDSLFNNSSVNDNGFVMVFNGRAEDALRHEVKGFPSAADMLEGISRNLNNYNFFMRRYDLMDIYRLSTTEGKCLLMPYVELRENNFEVTGLAIFKNYKMVDKLGISDVKYLNMMRESKATGVITQEKNSIEYLNLNAMSKRKIKCSRGEDGKYRFTIEISCSGNLVFNELYPGLANSAAVKKQSEKELVEEVERECRRVIHKLQHVYGIDALQLGSYAAAKYGRHSGTDWDEVVSDSKVDVKVKIEAERIGRGDF